MKANIISKALTLGGGSWSVYGLQDQGFSNDVRESCLLYTSTRRSDDKASRPFITYTLNAPANPILIQQYAEENIKTVLGQ